MPLQHAGVPESVAGAKRCGENLKGVLRNLVPSAKASFVKIGVMDVFTKKKRSQVMAAIRDRHNKSTERTFAALLRSRRISGWKLHSANVFGKPDFYFNQLRLAVFVDGCFWHGCPKCFHAPRQNASFWAQKIRRNRNRDRRVTKVLRAGGITVLRLWEHDLARKAARVRRALAEIAASTVAYENGYTS